MQSLTNLLIGTAYAVVAVAFVLGVMILVHEFGHYAVAKLCGVRVDVFSLGFGKRLFGFIRGKVDTNEDAEDLLQDVWYRFSQITNLDEVESVSGWLFSVARNLAFVAHDGDIQDSYAPCTDARLSYVRDVFNGFAEPNSWGLTPAQFGYDPSIKPGYKYDLDTAKKLLLEAGKELGFGPDKPRDMVLISNATAPWQGYIATQLASNISKLNVGLKLDVKALSFTEYVNSWRSQLTSFSIHSSFSLTADPNPWLSAFGTTAGFWARTSSYSNPKADDLYKQQFQALDPKQRAKLISELMQTVNDDVDWVWIGAATAYGQPTFNPNVLRTSVKGFYYNPTYQGFYFPALWKE